MNNRNWIEQIFKNAILKADPDIEKISNNPELLHELLEGFYPIVLREVERDFRKNFKPNLSEQKKERNEFKKRLYQKWKKPLDLLDALIFFNIECGEKITNSYRKASGEDVKFETLVRLHARACQVAGEVLELLKSGFADGAMARWRTLYEISIYANFLVDKPSELCQKYLDYYMIESYSEAIEFQKNCKELGYRPFSKKEMKENEDMRKELAIKYGDDFLKSHGWLSGVLPKGKCNFAGVEETIDFSHFRSFYKMANNSVHAGSKAIIFKLGLFRQGKVMLAGPSNYGLADPGQITANSLLHTLSTLTEFEDYIENSIFLEVSESLVCDISEQFLKVQMEIEAEEKSAKRRKK